MTLRELVTRRIAELQKPLLDAVMSGVATPEYYLLIGKYQGMAQALREIDGLLDEEFDED